MADTEGQREIPRLFGPRNEPLVSPQDNNDMRVSTLVSFDAHVQPRGGKRGIFISPALNGFYRTHERVMWDFQNIPYDQIDRSKITGDDVNAIRAAMLVESHNPVYTQVLLDYFRQDHEMAAFTVVWSYEELKHYAGLRAYLEATDLVDVVELEDELQTTRVGPWGDVESKFTPTQSFAYTMLQEEITAEFYQKFARRTQEPVLKGLLNLIGKDERRHCQWYLTKAKESLKNNPAAVDEVHDMLLRFEMPGPSFIQEYGKHGAAMLKMAPPDGDALTQVTRKVAELTGGTSLAKLSVDSVYQRRMQKEWNITPKGILGL